MLPINIGFVVITVDIITASFWAFVKLVAVVCAAGLINISFFAGAK
jgi:uncharacterized membrane protein